MVTGSPVIVGAAGPRRRVVDPVERHTGAMASAEGDGVELVDFGAGQLTRLRGLDGLRGLAVAAVLCFHGGWDWMAGGWLGVSLFFTLSGFLITSLLLAEGSASDSGSSIVLRTFWGRRFRRLLPAAWLTIGAVLAVVWLIGDASQARSVRVDALSSLGQVANWRFLLAGTSYADLFRSPSPLLHFWSLAIEEQLYLVLPMLVAVLLLVGRGSRRVLGSVLGLALVASWTEPMLFGLGHDRTYYGTDTRAGELLVGALLAVVMASPSFRWRLALRPSWRNSAAALGAISFGAMVVLWVSTDESSRFVTDGGLAVHGMLAVLVIIAAVVPAGPLQRFCRLAPLAWLGRVSYGVYLFHWPLFVFLSQERTGLSRAPRFVLVVTLSLLLAELSARFFERPVRERQGVLGVAALRPALMAPVAVVALIAGSIALSPAGRASTAFDAEAALARIRRINRSTAVATTTPPAPTTAPAAAAPAPAALPAAAPRPPAPAPTIALFGDSTAISIRLVLDAWGRGGQLRDVEGLAAPGLGMVRGGQRRFNGVTNLSAGYDSWPTTFARRIDREKPQVVVVSTGQWDLVDRKLAGDQQWRHIGDPVYDERLRQEYEMVTDVLASRGAMVVWLTLARFRHGFDDQLSAAQREVHEDVRVDRLNQIISEVVTSRSGTARLVDLAGWMSPHIEDASLRSDGTHYDLTASNTVASSFLGPTIQADWNEWWSSSVVQ